MTTDTARPIFMIVKPSITSPMYPPKLLRRWLAIAATLSLTLTLGLVGLVTSPSQAATAVAFPSEKPTDGISLAFKDGQWAAIMSAAAIAANCPSGKCLSALEGFYSDNGDTGVPVSSHFSGQLSFTADAPTQNFGGSLATYYWSPYATHVRVKVYDSRGGGQVVYGAWTQVGDPLPDANPTVSVQSYGRQNVQARIDGGYIFLPGHLCEEYTCNITFFGYIDQYRAWQRLGSPSRSDNLTFDATYFGDITRVQAIIQPLSPNTRATFTTRTTVVNLSHENYNGVDVTYAAALLAAKQISTAEFCLPLNNVRSPGDGSVSRAYLACDEAMRTGGIAKAVSAVNSYGRGLLTILEAAYLNRPVASGRTAPSPPPRVGDDPDGYTPTYQGSPEQELADIEGSITARNTTTYKLSSSIVKQVARTCYQWAAMGLAPVGQANSAGSGSTSPCSAYPIFMPGADVKEAATHDVQAIQSYTPWVRLTRGTSPTWSKNWYRSYDVCKTIQSGKNCDEYPFASAKEGGAADSSISPAKPMASLKQVNSTQNQLEGSRLNSFYSACAIGVTRQYLVIPIYGNQTISTTTANTAFVCGK